MKHLPILYPEGYLEVPFDWPSESRHILFSPGTHTRRITSYGPLQP